MKPGDGDYLSPSGHLRWPDPRSSSTQSLVPSESGADAAESGAARPRRLLLIYIHGFYGNKQSFNSFPAHLHAYLKDALSGSHVIHTKIYPRYKTYRAISVGVENFSRWLEPHEDDETDVVLVGHSMGGILAADLILLPNPDPFQPRPYKHRILGMLAMDAPYLGLHPGIVPSGIASLFRRDETTAKKDQDVSQAVSATELSGEEAASTTAPSPDDTLVHLSSSTAGEPFPPTTGASPPISALSSPSTASPPPTIPPTLPASPPPDPHDPTFDPPWHNDVHLAERSRLTSLTHFAKKHFSEGILNAAGRHFLSHMEYGACLADYRQLHARYNDLRRLEDVDPSRYPEDDAPAGEPSFRGRAVRVRFVNYYTAATGRPKKEKKKGKDKDRKKGKNKNKDDEQEGDGEEEGNGDRSNENLAAMTTITPRISVEVHEGNSTASVMSSDTSQPPSTRPAGTINTTDSTTRRGSHDTAAPPTLSEPTQPPPPPPLPPRPSDPREAAAGSKKELLQAAYDEALKVSRKKLLKHTFRFLDKRERFSTSAAPNPADPSLHLSDHRRRASETTAASPPPLPTSHPPPAYSPPSPPSPDPAHGEPQSTSSEPMPANMRKFCATPKRHGEIDRTWVSVPMRGIDEVDAHVSMFLAQNAHYEGLVADAGDRVVGWLAEDVRR